ncbi:hypothetical protein BD769DRAFT_508055 [Suillus cothurnatus]|nr:hypothetical protein BD769DRAFT_508055 [Suillus cothurnatus]
MACGSAHLHLFPDSDQRTLYLLSKFVCFNDGRLALLTAANSLRLRRRSTFFTSSFLRNDLHYSLYLLHSFSKHPQLTRHGLVPSQRPRSPTMLLSRRVQISLSLLCRLLYWTEDPFANLHSSSSVIPFSERADAYSNPSIASHPPRSSTVLLPSQAYLQHHNSKRPKSSGHGQVRPAHTRPAFSPRPSLPSLYTLAQMNIGIPRKPRKGTPGARLPHEPWDMKPTSHLGVTPPSTESIAAPSQRQRAATCPANARTFGYQTGLHS